MYLSRRARAAYLALTITISVSGSAYTSAFANGGDNPKELVKYLNPFQKKGYLNESQDRIIKKKKFKTEKLPQIVETATNRELGFFAIVPTDKLTDVEYCSELLKRKNVNGLSVLLPWNMLEPSEDNFNWEPVDKLIAACEQAGKTIILRVSACGIDTPTSDGKEVIGDLPRWVIDSGIKTIKYNDAQGREHQMPLFWDKDYLAKWNNLVVEMAERYDKNKNIHSIGITGGGYQGSTSVLPPADTTALNEKGEKVDVKTALKKDFAMTQRDLVTHWKYVADVFPKHFQTARLNFNINAPIRGRAGEDSLDEIADYLIYRYGERIFVTRQGMQSGKHKFDDFRLLLKYRNDTLTGVQFPDNLDTEDMASIVKNALDDGVSYVEVPVALLDNKDEKVQSALDHLATHIGYQIIQQKAALSEKIAQGQPLKASFAFVNVGAAAALRPERMFDKDQPSSYRVQIELRDAEGKPVLQNLHTPPVPTTKWSGGQTITWEEELKMVDGDKHQLPPGQYTAWLSIVDPDMNRKIQFLNATTGDKPASTDTVEIGKVTITNDVVADTKVEAKAKAAGGTQGN